MSKVDRFPLLIRNQSVVVKIYRVAAKTKTSPNGFAHVVAWIGPNGRESKWVVDFKEAKEFAESKATQLASGLAQGQQFDRTDVLELTELRRIAGDLKVPPLSAMQEWAKARELAGPAILEACQAWSERRTSSITRIKVQDAIEQLVKDKNALGKQGTQIYGKKLKAVGKALGDAFLDTITAKMWNAFLGRIDDPVTRNDVRKRIVTLCRWAQKNGHLLEDLKPEIEKTELAKEISHPIGILTPEILKDLLEFFRAKHPRHLAALVTAALCGVRSEEIHGKKADPAKRQRWEDIHLDRGFLSVTAAKENTPSNRVVNLSTAALAWFKACPGKREGHICQKNAIARVRDIAIHAGFELPNNCFRHSWISYRIALTGDKASTANEAGNSVKIIDRRYRVPLPKFQGEQWFATRPKRENGRR